MKYCFLMLFFLLLSNCVTSIEMRKTDLFASSSRFQERHKIKADAFLFGLVQGSDTIKVWEQCPKDWHRVRITRSFWQVALSLFTLGIYTPMRVVIICGSTGYTEDPPQADDDEFKLFESTDAFDQQEDDDLSL